LKYYRHIALVFLRH